MGIGSSLVLPPRKDTKLDGGGGGEKVLDMLKVGWWRGGRGGGHK